MGKVLALKDQIVPNDLVHAHLVYVFAKFVLCELMQGKNEV